MSKNSIDIYNKQATRFFEQYESLDATTVHKDWIFELPSSGLVLDIGAGSGRDAAYIAAQGLHVFAVEPAHNLRQLAQQKHTNTKITWLDDSLPDLQTVHFLQVKFDLILISAVWMHFSAAQQNRILRKVSNLLKPGGRMIISLRFGTFDDDRPNHDISLDQLNKQAQSLGLSVTAYPRQIDELQRSNVSWQTVKLSLPDNGTGAFALIRHITLNDNKSSTYKIALLRTLVRIAEAHPGSATELSKDTIKIPLGLVAFHWFKLFKPLIDEYNMQQNSNPAKGLGFIKADGWQALTTCKADDFQAGNVIHEKPIAAALFNTLKHIGQTIKDMPAKHITIPGSSDHVFHVETKRTTLNTSFRLDNEFFSSFGFFNIPVNVWHTLSNYSVWIEPVLVNEWVKQMSGYRKNQAFSTSDFLQALVIPDTKHSTQSVSQRVKELLSKHRVPCIWTDKPLTAQTRLHIDHCFPFSRWPNNDLWNLLPTSETINSKKSARLPGHNRLLSQKTAIIEWWTLAWSNKIDKFFSQAKLSLPGLMTGECSFERVFDAMLVQRARILEIQQLEEW